MDLSRKCFKAKRLPKVVSPAGRGLQPRSGMFVQNIAAWANSDYPASMVQARISWNNKSALYFVTPTVVSWYYIFDRHDRWQILADSFQYLQKTRGLEIHAYVFMLNHVHLIIQAPNVAAVMRDFKPHTTRQIKSSLTASEPQMLDLFTRADGTFKFWKSDNGPKMIAPEKFYLQKLNYIHNNPVHKGYVEQPEYWKWSSANPHSAIKTVAVV